MRKWALWPRILQPRLKMQKPGKCNSVLIRRALCTQRLAAPRLKRPRCAPIKVHWRVLRTCTLPTQQIFGRVFLKPLWAVSLIDRPSKTVGGSCIASLIDQPTQMAFPAKEITPYPGRCGELLYVNLEIELCR